MKEGTGEFDLTPEQRQKYIDEHPILKQAVWEKKGNSELAEQETIQNE